MHLDAIGQDNLGKTAAAPAAEHRLRPLEILTKRETTRWLSRELLVELRIELQGRLVIEFTEMHETQIMIRETTQSQAPKVAQKSRTALLTVAALSKKRASSQTAASTCSPWSRKPSTASRCRQHFTSSRADAHD